MEITRVEPRKVRVRPRKYAREVDGFLVAEDDKYYYWVDWYEDFLHKFDKKDKKNFKFLSSYKGIIYIITNDINNKVYIGETTSTIANRYSQHLSCANDVENKKPLYEDMRKYGVEHFKIEKLADVDCWYSSSIAGIENQFIRFLNSITPNGYNIRCSVYGGDFKYLWQYIRSLNICKESSYYSILKQFVDENFKLEKWDMYRNFDLSNIYVDAIKAKKDESITIDIKRNRKPSKCADKIICKHYNSFYQSREELEKTLIEEFKEKLKEVLDQEIEFSRLNDSEN